MKKLKFNANVSPPTFKCFMVLFFTMFIMSSVFANADADQNQKKNGAGFADKIVVSDIFVLKIEENKAVVKKTNLGVNALTILPMDWQVIAMEVNVDKKNIAGQLENGKMLMRSTKWKIVNLANTTQQKISNSVNQANNTNIDAIVLNAKKENMDLVNIFNLKGHLFI